MVVAKAGLKESELVEMKVVSSADGLVVKMVVERVELLADLMVVL